jgi:hypothetical protein
VDDRTKLKCILRKKSVNMECSSNCHNISPLAGFSISGFDACAPGATVFVLLSPAAQIKRSAFTSLQAGNRDRARGYSYHGHGKRNSR